MPAPVFFIVLPVLREAAVIAEALTHFQALIHGHAAHILVVTTEREAVETQRRRRCARDTVAVVEQLARDGTVVHLHYPDPAGSRRTSSTSPPSTARPRCCGMCPSKRISAVL